MLFFTSMTPLPLAKSGRLHKPYAYRFVGVNTSMAISLYIALWWVILRDFEFWPSRSPVALAIGSAGVRSLDRRVSRCKYTTRKNRCQEVEVNYFTFFSSPFRLLSIFHPFTATPPDERMKCESNAKLLHRHPENFYFKA